MLLLGTAAAILFIFLQFTDRDVTNKSGGGREGENIELSNTGSREAAAGGEAAAGTGAKDARRESASAAFVHPARISGVVKDAAGRAVAGAQMMAFPANRPEPVNDGVDFALQPDVILTKSGADGTFLLQFDRRFSYYTVIARADGFGPAGVEWVEPERACEIVMKPGVVMRGGVYNFEKAPVARARVERMSVLYNLIIRQTAETGADGSYELKDCLRMDAPGGQVHLQHLQYNISATGFVRLQTEGAERAGPDPGVFRQDFYLSRGAKLILRALDEATGKPISNATIQYWSTELNTTFLARAGNIIYNPDSCRELGSGVTDANGVFICKDVPTWGYSWHRGASADVHEAQLGYAVARVAGTWFGWVEIRIPDQGEEKTLDIYCKPVARASGRVVDSTGKPVQGAHVFHYASERLERGRPFGMPGRKGLQTFEEITNNSGMYQIEFPVEAAAETDVTIAALVEPLYYGEQRIRFRPNAKIELPDIVLKKRDDMAVVRVRVTGPDGKPLWGALVGQNLNLYRHSAITDHEGRAEMPLNNFPGAAVPPFRIFVKYTGMAGASSEPIQLRNDSPVDVNIQMSPGRRIRGVVLMPSGKPAVSGYVTAFGNDASFAQLENYAQEAGAPPAFITSGSAGIHKDGSFEILDLPAGMFTLSATACTAGAEVQEGVAWMENVPVDSENVSFTILNLRKTAPVATAESAAPATRSLVIRVTDERGRAPERGNMELIQPGTGFRIPSSLAWEPGLYTLEAAPGIHRITGRFPGYSSEIVRIDVPAGTTPFEIDYKIRRGAVLTGRLRTSEGKLLHSGKVYLYRGSEVVAGEVDREGNYQIRGIGAGTWQTILADATIHRDAREYLTVTCTTDLYISENDSRVERDFVLERAGYLQLLISAPSLPAAWERNQLSVLDAAGIELIRVGAFEGRPLTLPVPYGKYHIRLELDGGGVITKEVLVNAGNSMAMVMLDR